MEVRCASCNKLFRVSDDKITGIGIKFSCTRCHSIVKITRGEFERYSLSRATVKSAAASLASVPIAQNRPAVAPAAAATMGAPAPAASRPAPVPGPGNGGSSAAVQNKPTPIVKAATVSPEVKAAPRPKAEPAVTAVRPAVSPAPAVLAAGDTGLEEPFAATVADNDISSAPTGSSLFKKLAVLIVVLLVLAGGAFGVKSYLGKNSKELSETVRVITSPDGLQVQNAAGTIDQTNQDLIITGVVQNTTDKPRPAWYIMVDVYDAQNAVITKGRLLSGKQLYSRRDFEILTKRGANLEDLRMKTLEQGITIPPQGFVNFEIRLMEPPVGIASFNVTLQPFDPVQMFKEIAEEQK